MKIAMINNSRGWGGAEQVLLSLAVRLRERGHLVEIFLRSGSLTIDRFAASGLEVHQIERSLSGAVSGMLAMIGIIRRGNFDLVHVHRNHDLPVGKVAAVAARVPLILTQHCQLGKTSSFLINLADSIVAVSYFIGTDMEKRFPVLRGKVKVVHNGIDLHPFITPGQGFWQNVPEVADASPLLGVIGYFYKNQEELIEMLPAIRELLPGTKLAIIGRDDEKKPALEQRARDLGVADAVYFAGRIPHDQIGAALAGLDFNVSAFRREGCALNVIEALAVGTPFAGYRSGSYPELVEDGVTGILADSQGELVSKLAKTVHNPEVVSSMREAARKSAFARFTLDRMVDTYEQLYQRSGV